MEIFLPTSGEIGTGGEGLTQTVDFDPLIIDYRIAVKATFAVTGYVLVFTRVSAAQQIQMRTTDIDVIWHRVCPHSSWILPSEP